MSANVRGILFALFMSAVCVWLALNFGNLLIEIFVRPVVRLLCHGV